MNSDGDGGGSVAHPLVPPPFVRTQSGLPLCGDCHSPAGQCEHTDFDNISLGGRTLSVERMYLYDTDLQLDSPCLKRQLTADEKGNSIDVCNDNKRLKLEEPTKWFVFCGDACKAAKIGRLSYVCVGCRSSGFVPHRAPKDWRECVSLLLRGRCATCQHTKDWGRVVPRCGTCNNLAIPLPQMTTNDSKQACMACFSEDEDIIITFGCDHVQCVECFVNFASSRLRERKLWFDSNDTRTYTLSCALGCQHAHVDSQMFRLLGSQMYQRYKRFAALSYADDHKIMWCPLCKRGFMPQSLSSKSSFVTCYACNQVYCMKCNTKHARNASCAENEGRSADELASLAVIREITKPCPKCHTPVFKSGGCNHMTCTQCNCEWCWLHECEWGDSCRVDHWTDNPLTTRALVVRHRLQQQAQSWCLVC